MKVQLLVDGQFVDLDHTDVADLAWSLGRRREAADVLARLADHPHEAVKVGVACSDHLPADVHRQLAASSSDKLAAAALQSKLACALDSGLLLSLARRPYDVASAVVRLLDQVRPELRGRVIPALLSHADPAIRVEVISEMSPSELQDHRAALLGDSCQAVVLAFRDRGQRQESGT